MTKYLFLSLLLLAGCSENKSSSKTVTPAPATNENTVDSAKAEETVTVATEGYYLAKDKTARVKGIYIRPGNENLWFAENPCDPHETVFVEPGTDVLNNDSGKCTNVSTIKGMINDHLMVTSKIGNTPEDYIELLPVSKTEFEQSIMDSSKNEYSFEATGEVCKSESLDICKKKDFHQLTRKLLIACTVSHGNSVIDADYYQVFMGGRAKGTQFTAIRKNGKIQLQQLSSEEVESLLNGYIMRKGEKAEKAPALTRKFLGLKLSWDLTSLVKVFNMISVVEYLGDEKLETMQVIVQNSNDEEKKLDINKLLSPNGIQHSVVGYDADKDETFRTKVQIKCHRDR